MIEISELGKSIIPLFLSSDWKSLAIVFLFARYLESSYEVEKEIGSFAIARRI
jgi:hypothetical protein